MIILIDKDTINKYIVPHLSKAKRGYECKAELWEVVNAIFYKFKTGVQWKYLPIKSLISSVELKYGAVYHHFRKWAEDGSWQRVWKNLLFRCKHLLDLSIAQTWEPNIGTYIYDAFPYVGVTAKRKGIPCIWYPYKTNITWDNFHVEYIMDGNPKVTWTEGYMFDYAKRIEPKNGDSFLGDYNPTFEWKKIRSTVGSRGMGTKTLDINKVW